MSNHFDIFAISELLEESRAFAENQERLVKAIVPSITNMVITTISSTRVNQKVFFCFFIGVFLFSNDSIILYESIYLLNSKSKDNSVPQTFYFTAILKNLQIPVNPYNTPRSTLFPLLWTPRRSVYFLHSSSFLYFLQEPKFLSCPFPIMS